jgi:hypothetical protein
MFYVPPQISTFGLRIAGVAAHSGNDPCGPQLSKPTQGPLDVSTVTRGERGELSQGASRFCTPPCASRGQVSVLDNRGRWYYGTYGRPRVSHLRSFNRALYR